MTLRCVVFALLLATADLTSAAMAVNCTVHTALPECISDKIYTAIVATIGITLALVIGIFIVGILLIRRQRSTPVSSDSAAETERGVRRAAENLYLPAGPRQQRGINKDLTIYTAKPIGGGAFGTVFPCSYRGNPCAVKVLNPHATQLLSSLPASQTVQIEALQRFRNECNTLKSFKHPNLVRYIASCNDPKSNLPVLVMELMGESLTQFLKKCADTGKYPHLCSTRSQISLSHNIASALGYIHTKHLVHRDLCSDNVLLQMRSSPIPLAKISDFGMSKLIDPDDLKQSLTTLGHREAYLPPEARKITSNEYDSSLDIFSFGVVMVQMVKSVSRITCSADRDLYIQEIKNAELPSPLYQLIVCCVQVDRASRPNAVQITEQLDTLSVQPQTD